MTDVAIVTAIRARMAVCPSTFAQLHMTSSISSRRRANSREVCDGVARFGVLCCCDDTTQVSRGFSAMLCCSWPPWPRLARFDGQASRRYSIDFARRELRSHSALPSPPRHDTDAHGLALAGSPGPWQQNRLQRILLFLDVEAAKRTTARTSTCRPASDSTVSAR